MSLSTLSNERTFGSKRSMYCGLIYVATTAAESPEEKTQCSRHPSGRMRLYDLWKFLTKELIKLRTQHQVNRQSIDSPAMAANCSVLTHPRPFGTPTLPDFDICDRRYGMNLDIPRCDVAASRLDVGSASTAYQISDRAGPHTLPQSINYGWGSFENKPNGSNNTLTI